MKNFKRLVSVLLCIITLFMLAIPAFAVEENDDKMPVITQQPKDIVIVKPFLGLYDPNPGPEVYCPEFEVSLPSEYHYLVTLYREGKVVRDAYGVNRAPCIERDLDDSGVYYLVITNVDYPEYTVKSEPFKVTFVEKPFSEKFDIFIKSIGPLMVNTIEGFFNGAFIAFLYALANIIAVPYYIFSKIFK